MLDSDIVWLDAEMTGLDITKDKIIEIAVVVTDSDLNVKVEGPNLVINWPKQVFENMNTWCQLHHKQSNLIDECLKSQIDLKKAEQIILKFLQKHIPESRCPLAGNSVYMDRLFLKNQMPAIDNYLHYHIIDVSTIKQLVLRWRPDLIEIAPAKKKSHRSLPDIMESIAELKFYRENFLKIST